MSSAKSHYGEFLKALGFQGDEELEGTPERVAEFYREFAPKSDPPTVNFLETETSEPIVLKDLPFYSLCAHHLVPFFGTAAIGILPDKKIAGFGCIVRCLHHFSRQPQLQERLGNQLVQHLSSALDAKCVLVELKSRQMCMEMRGVRTPGEINTLHRAYSPSAVDDEVQILEKLFYG